MTPELLKTLLPRSLHGNATQEFADLVNQVVSDPDDCELIRNNFVTYSSVLRDGKYKTEDYLNAVAYCTHKLMGLTNTESYQRAFPKRYQALVAAGKNQQQISSYVAAYHKNKLVNEIMGQTLIPTHLLFQDVFFEAIKTQRDLMIDRNVSPKVRADAANSLLTHLKAPEAKKVELDVNVKSDGLAELRAALSAVATDQLQRIEAGTLTPKAAGAQALFPKEPVDAEFTVIGVDMATEVEEVQENSASASPHSVEDNEPPTELTRAKRKSIFDIDPSNPGASA